MTTMATQSGQMTMRHLRNFARQPWWIAISLAQPVIWLVLFGQLFKRVVELPGFATTSYITFLTPAIVVMTALFSGSWSGMGIIQDLDRGVIDRFLITPVNRGALITGRLLQGAAISVVQSLIIVGLGVALGARFGNGPIGLAVMLLDAALLGAALGSLSNALALLMRREESLIGAVQFIALPLQFLSTAFMAQALVPAWIRTASRYNPVNWALEASRAALVSHPDWGFVLSRSAWLLAFTVICGWLSVRAFRSYQRSV